MRSNLVSSKSQHALSGTRDPVEPPVTAMANQNAQKSASEPLQSSSKQLYSYHKSTSNNSHFRLLKILPLDSDAEGMDGSWEIHGDICGEIIETAIDGNIEYHALSYCWTGHKVEAEVEEKSEPVQPRRLWAMAAKPDKKGLQSAGYIPITDSLFEALQHLRDANQEIPIFVDQICINQADKAERSSQVMLMGHIYRMAASVLAWLGPSTQDSTSFMEYASRWSGQKNGPSGKVSEEHEMTWETFARTAEKLHDDLGGDVILEENRIALRDLISHEKQLVPVRGLLDVLSRAWFRRMWIVQEACLASDLIFLCGRDRCRFDAFQKALILFNVTLFGGPLDLWRLDRHVGDIPGSPLVNQVADACGFSQRIFNARKLIRNPHASSKKDSLMGLVSSFSSEQLMFPAVEKPGSYRFRATDPRDYIYSLLGIADPDDPVLRGIQADYNQPVETVLISFARLCMHYNTDLLLYSQPERKSLKSLPSWVPDWSSSPYVPAAYRNPKLPFFKAGQTTNKTGSTPSPVVTTSGGFVLRVQGVLLGAVSEIGEYCMTGANNGMVDSLSLARFLIETRKFCKASSEICGSASIPSAEDLDRAIWLTSTGGTGLDISTSGQGDPLGGDVNGRPLLGQLYDAQLDLTTSELQQMSQYNSLERHLRLIMEEWRGDTRWRYPILTGLQQAVRFWMVWLLAWALPTLTQTVIRTIQTLAWGPNASNLERELYIGLGVRLDGRFGSFANALKRQVNRRCFRTLRGHVGLGPLAMEPKDMVVILQGSSSPMVLRPGRTPQDPCTYLGEAYCHGFMQGEVFDGIEPEELASFQIG